MLGAVEGPTVRLTGPSVPAALPLLVPGTAPQHELLTWIPIAGDKFGLFEAEALVQGPRSRTKRIVFPIRRHEDILIGGEHIQHHADKGRSDAPPPRLRMYGEEADAVVLIREHQHAEQPPCILGAQRPPLRNGFPQIPRYSPSDSPGKASRTSATRSIQASMSASDAYPTAHS